jgi:hypothetical protein
MLMLSNFILQIVHSYGQRLASRDLQLVVLPEEATHWARHCTRSVGNWG